MERTRREDVGEFYAEAAREPMERLCCASNYDEDAVAHIPREVLDISYGCGSPVLAAGLAAGDTLVDLGSGGGIDCFIAARVVGEGGRVVGVDMTNDMLEKAARAAERVASNLGYDVVEFRKGFLEGVPVEDSAADVVTSNCVVNLAENKRGVFSEIYRILKDRGRFCISDVVSEGDVPESMRSDRRLWGECISGALREDEFLSLARGAGFYGLKVLSSAPYREVEGVRFNSVTVSGFKFAKSPECVYRGHRAAYLGPFSSVTDDDGHTYAAGVPVEICTDTLAKLTDPPYRGMFSITGPDRGPGDEKEDPAACNPGECC
ncbi:MAG: methyltransferase domain-containing protein [Thermodesulfobacteriota bacterium]